MTTISTWQRQLRTRGTSAAAVTAALASILAAWQVAVLVGNRVPSVTDSIQRLITEAEVGELWHNLALSMNRFVLGLAAALIVGAVIGVLMGLSRLADLAFSDLN
ncbi:MAG: nitrate ABC transporter permease, partial [Mycobacterium sp.]|nr:nitrate ABC transporter permease [Mycobacterium sp.]